MQYEVLRNQTPAPFECLFNPEHPDAKKMFKVFRGGRGSGKSWQIGRSLCIKGAEKKERILCGREYQNSMEESVMALVQDQAKYVGLGDFYRSTQTETVGLNGTQFIYKGLKQNINNLKSLEGAKRF